jgi:tRNA C32,U32 (ribose-2'-O)-methylase TrmJ
MTAIDKCRANPLIAGVLEMASVFPSVESAVADLVAVFATTARLRDMTYLVGNISLSAKHDSHQYHAVGHDRTSCTYHI